MSKKINNKQKECQEPKFVFDEYRNLNSYRKMPINNIWLDRLAKDLCNWVKTDITAVNFGPFLLEKGLLQNEFKRLRDKHPALQQAYEFALQIIGSRRDAGATERKYDGSYVRHTMPLFDKEHKELYQWWAKIKADEEEAKKNITVIMQPFSDTEMVTKKKEEQNA